MPRGNGAPPNVFANFFIGANYRFSTMQPGRSSTWYFCDPANNLGRYRSQHHLGPSLAYQGQCNRIFVSPALEAQRSVLAEMALRAFEFDTQDDADEAFADERYRRIREIFPVLQRGDPDHVFDDKASLQAHIGWHLFDFRGQTSHFSAGVVAPDPRALQFFHGGADLANGYNGPWEQW
jgi:hypothetical protein